MLPKKTLKNVIFIGPSFGGKTSLNGIFAEFLGYYFVDIDHKIEVFFNKNELNSDKIFLEKKKKEIELAQKFSTKDKVSVSSGEGLIFFQKSELIKDSIETIRNYSLIVFVLPTPNTLNSIKEIIKRSGQNVKISNSYIEGFRRSCLICNKVSDMVIYTKNKSTDECCKEIIDFIDENYHR